MVLRKAWLLEQLGGELGRGAHEGYGVVAVAEGVGETGTGAATGCAEEGDC